MAGQLDKVEAAFATANATLGKRVSTLLVMPSSKINAALNKPK